MVSCKQHRKYTGVQMPRGGCPYCWRLWTEKNQLGLASKTSAVVNHRGNHVGRSLAAAPETSRVAA